MADFLGQYCGEYGNGKCRCKDRVNYAIQYHRIAPLRPDYTAATETPLETVVDVNFLVSILYAVRTNRFLHFVAKPHNQCLYFFATIRPKASTTAETAIHTQPVRLDGGLPVSFISNPKFPPGICILPAGR